MVSTLEPCINTKIAQKVSGQAIRLELGLGMVSTLEPCINTKIAQKVSS